MSTMLINQVRGLVDHARRRYGGGPAEVELAEVAGRLTGPLRVAIAGRVKAGKSTLLNALVGQELAATDAGECTKIVTWYQDGVSYRVTMFPRAGAPRQLRFSAQGGALSVDLGDTPVEQVDRLVVDWPSATLRRLTLIDTPGIGSVQEGVSERTEAALAPEEDGAGTADAVIYLLRHLHGGDVRFLEAFRDDPAQRRAVNTIGVLSRADEVGHARPDALDSAARIAARYRSDHRIRALCQTVIPVAGLLAATAATLREAEYRAVTVLAAAPDDELERLLLTADRFARGESGIALPVGERAALLDRLGMYGVKAAVGMVRAREVSSAGTLASALLSRSGLHDLWTLLTTQFAERADVLKARSALGALGSVLRRYPHPASDELLHELERLASGAHEFTEIQLIDALRFGAIMFGTDECRDAERLLGGSGVDVYTRLDLPPHAGSRAVAEAGRTALLRWQRRAEHPASPRDVREAARVLVRTCEGILMNGIGTRTEAWR
jgi:hypothetical protein